MVKALFLDRDGVVNEAARRGEYHLKPEDIRLMPGIQELIRVAREREYFVIVITNQSPIGQGLLTEDQLKSQHAKMHQDLLPEKVDALYYCPHAKDDGCICRKPQPGMLLKAAEELGIDLASSFFVGDNFTDVLAGQAAGCKTVFLNSDQNQDERVKCTPDYVVVHLEEVVRLL